MRRRTIGYIVVGAIGLAAAVWLGVGLYQAGLAQGAIAEGSEIVVGRGYPYYPGFYGFGVIGIMFRALFALLFFGLVARLFFFRTWAHHRGWHGPGSGGDEWQGPGRFGPGGPRGEEFRRRVETHLAEWHERVHAEPDETLES